MPLKSINQPILFACLHLIVVIYERIIPNNQSSIFKNSHTLKLVKGLMIDKTSNNFRTIYTSYKRATVKANIE